MKINSIIDALNRRVQTLTADETTQIKDILDDEDLNGLEEWELDDLSEEIADILGTNSGCIYDTLVGVISIIE